MMHKITQFEKKMEARFTKMDEDLADRKVFEEQALKIL